MRLQLIPVAAALLFALPQVHAQYKLPPAELQAIVDAPRAPTLLLSPKRDLAAMVQTPALPPIAEVAQPELKLAGVRINPRTYAASRFSFGTGLSLLDVNTGKEARITGLPANLRLADRAFSPDQRYLAFTHVTLGANQSGVELWLVDIEKRAARRLLAQQLSAVAGSGFDWLPDSKGLVVTLRVPGKAPEVAGVPSGPATQDSQEARGNRSIRTYQDLLKNEEDAKLFEHYITSQLATVNLAGKVQLAGKPDAFLGVSVAPGGKHVLATVVQRPYSYIVPVNMFPQKTDVRELDGKVLHTVSTRPLVEGLPPGSDAVVAGVRNASWRADAPATLVWAEAQDGGDPNAKADVRDIVYTQAAPFKDAPAVLAKLGSRYAGVRWGRGDFAILSERWIKTRAAKQWRIQPDKPAAAPELLFSYSSEDRYNLPGTAITMPDAAGQQRLVFGPGDTLLLAGAGASAEGDRPYIDRFNPADKSKTRLFQSAAPFYEEPVAVLDNEGKRLLTSRESPTERPNFYVRSVADGKLTALTSFPHPTPQLKEVQKELIRYKRADGVDLTATLLLPPKYDAKRDGPLPMLMWAYPQEFKSAAAASQTIGSPYRFTGISMNGPAPFLAMGYAVLDNPTMPIVGAGEAEPNDTYLPQLVASAEAAVEEVVKRGVADRNRIAVGGHSYGAFMTGNLLAHTRLFKAGIARSGAYNRTLTPFGFQSEERQFWKAPEVYQAMSPFNNAHKIKDAILFIHGEEDNNPGTFPMQSERMFQAVKGLGGTARLVMLPNESHGYRARESIMHMLYETNAWLDKYVKNAKP